VSARKYPRSDCGEVVPIVGTMFVRANTVTTFGAVPEDETFDSASTEALPTSQICSSADTAATTFPSNASSVRIVEPAPFPAVKSL